MYVIVVLETDSDTPGVAAVFGPFFTWERANERRNAAMLSAVPPDLVQVAQIETLPS